MLSHRRTAIDSCIAAPHMAGSPIQRNEQLVVCFSASASFGLTAVLLPAGAYCTRTALRRDRSLIPMAVIPILFGAQQSAEGLVWLGIHHDRPRLVAAASLVFLFFALCWWLFWIPFTVLVISRGRRPPIRWFIGGTTLAGLAGGLVLYAPLILSPGVLTTRIVGYSIQYRFPLLPPLSLLPVWVLPATYLVIIVAPLLASRARPLLGFAIVLTLLAVMSQIVYWYCFVSVWCFFAAVLSFHLCFLFGHSLALSAVIRQPLDQSIKRSVPVALG